MIKLKNPYADHPDYNCFGCSPTNHMGLRMEFYEDDDDIVCHWQPGDQYQGFHDILHGGIQATMMDEIASWVVFLKLDSAGVTFRLNTRFRKPVKISRGEIVLRAKLNKQERNIASIDAKLMDGEGNICSDGKVEYFVFPRARAVKDMHFPGRQAFY